jgi:hypothetical protein
MVLSPSLSLLHSLPVKKSWIHAVTASWAAPDPSCCRSTRCYCLGSQSCAGFADLPVGHSILLTVHRSELPCPCHWIPPVAIARVHLSRLSPNTVHMFAFRPQSLFPGCSEPRASLFRPCLWHPFAQPLGGVFSALRSCSRFGSGLSFASPTCGRFEIPALLACVRSPDRLLSISLLSGQRRHALILARIIKVSGAITLWISPSSFHIPHPPTQRRLTVGTPGPRTCMRPTGTSWPPKGPTALDRSSV